MFETLYLAAGRQKVLIVENVPSADEFAFEHSAIDSRHTEAAQWRLNPDEDRVMFGVMRTLAKRAVFDFFHKKSGVQEEHFTSLISPRALIASNVVVSRGCYVEPAVVLSPYVRLGFGVTLNRSVSVGHHVEIGSYATINPGAHVGGHAKIGHDATIGIGAIVFDHIEIGERSVIGGGSVVTKRIPVGVIAYGNPCRVVRELSE